MSYLDLEQAMMQTGWEGQSPSKHLHQCEDLMQGRTCIGGSGYINRHIAVYMDTYVFALLFTSFSDHAPGALSVTAQHDTYIFG